MYRFLTGEVVPVEHPELLAHVPNHHLPWCFGCGPENRQGLGLRARFDDDRVVAELDFSPWFQGDPGVVHGGAVAAFFDDLMGFVPMAHQSPAVTARPEVNYLRPIPLGLTLRGSAWLAERSGRKLWAEGVGEDERGERYVESRARYLTVGAEHFSEAIEQLDPDQRKRIARFQEGGYYP